MEKELAMDVSTCSCKWEAIFNHEVAKDNVGYLPTINAPATNMSTAYQVLVKSPQIKETLTL